MKIREYYGGNIKFIKTNNLRENNICGEFTDYLTEEGNSLIARTTLRESDIITTIIGATFEIIGRTAMVCENDLPANINQNIALIRINKDIILPEVLNLYLNGKYGKNCMFHLSRQTEQVNLNNEELGRILVPFLTEEFQGCLKKSLKLIENHNEEAIKCYSFAEDLLLSHLGIQDYAPSAEPVAVKSFADSFGKTGRLDAEYYQPKYDEIEKKINGSAAVRIHDRNFTPKDNETYQYIELSNIGRNGNISESTIGLGHELPSRARRKVKTGQVIISSIEGSLSCCALVTEEYDGALCSTGFYVIDSDKINSETLLVIFKSFPIQMIMKRLCSGTILTAINKFEFESIRLPSISNSIQAQIADKVQESFRLRKESEQLLEDAKRAVEIAIEQDEKAAMDYLEQIGGEKIEL